MNAHTPPDNGGLPQSPSMFQHYLARERAFKNIGPKRAAALTEAFGDDLSKAILDQDEGVADIIGEEAALNAAAVLETRLPETTFLAWLDSLAAGIPASKAIRLARAWGPQGIDAIRKNPYLLIAITDWKTVDRIGAALNIGPKDERRQVAAVEATLSGSFCLGAGSTLLASQDALRAAERLLGYKCAAEVAEAAVKAGGALGLAGELQPPGAAHMEAYCALKLAQLAPQTPCSGITDPDTLDALLEEYEAPQPFPLTDAQREAVRMSHRHRLLVLAGYAGSGKTTVLKEVCQTQEALRKTPLIITLSGRAAQRANEATGRRAITVARFLIEQEKSDTLLDENTVLIADEASMLGLVEVWRILRRLGDASLILCGDPAQLPPVSPGVVFHALVRHPDIRKVVLDRVHRQDERTGIPALAEGVRDGIIGTLPPFTGAKPGVTFDACERDNLCHEIVRLQTALHADGNHPDHVQIIAPTNKEIDIINTHFHGLAMQGGPTLWPGTNIAVGEPIIWTVNNTERGLTNGALGRVLSIEDERICALLDGTEYELKEEDGQFVQLAYAISVHKAQGSQWPAVIIPTFPSKIVDRSLIYTALTRAQEQVHFLGSLNAMQRAIERPAAADVRKTGFGRYLDLVKEMKN
ncbi:MAG: AAA family ATPase [Paracoccaceae bacterium]|nr:AAA family ATPase [Paracoccaceae bacterium]